MQVWDVSAKPRLITTLTPPVAKGITRELLKATPHPIAFSGDGSRLAIAYNFGETQIWDYGQRKILFKVKSRWLPEAIRFSPTDLLSLVVRFTNNVVVSLVFDVRQRKLLRSAATPALANSASLVE